MNSNRSGLRQAATHGLPHEKLLFNLDFLLHASRMKRVDPSVPLKTVYNDLVGWDIFFAIVKKFFVVKEITLKI